MFQVKESFGREMGFHELFEQRLDSYLIPPLPHLLSPVLLQLLLHRATNTMALNSSFVKSWAAEIPSGCQY